MLCGIGMWSLNIAQTQTFVEVEEELGLSFLNLGNLSSANCDRDCSSTLPCYIPCKFPKEQLGRQGRLPLVLQ